MAKASSVNKSQAIRNYLESNARAKSKDVVAALAEKGIDVTPVLVSQVKGKLKGKKGKSKRGKPSQEAKDATVGRGKFPRHSVEKALRIPGLILAQNAGKPCTDSEAAKFAGLGNPKGVTRTSRGAGSVTTGDYCSC